MMSPLMDKRPAELWKHGTEPDIHRYDIGAGRYITLFPVTSEIMPTDADHDSFMAWALSRWPDAQFPQGTLENAIRSDRKTPTDCDPHEHCVAEVAMHANVLEILQ